MIDKLLCFDNGFIKFENNFLRICAAYKPEKAYFALFDGKFYCYEFKHHICLKSPIGKMPIGCGIFDNFYKPVFMFGNSNILKEEFYREYSQTENEKPIVLEKEPIKEQIIEQAIEPTEKDTNEEIKEEFNTLGQDEEIIDFLEEANEPNTYWQCNAKAFLEKFESGTEETELSALIPGSRWCKPHDEEYIMGIIFDEDEQPMYLCYGFENMWSENPPKDFEGYSQWIPKNFAEPHEEGYWVIYINAVTGERVK